MNSIRAINLFGSNISSLSFEQTIARITAAVRSKKRLILFPMNVHILTELVKQPDFQKQHNDAGITFADGVPILWLAKRIGAPLPGRVSGTDLVESMLTSEKRVFLVGSTPEVLIEMKKRYPKSICGTFSPPFSDVWPDEKIINSIRQSQAAIVLIGVGPLKQERWILKHFSKTGAKVAVACGSAFDILSEKTPRAPALLQRFGFEWLWRLIHEPKRLLGRYAVDVINLLVLLYSNGSKKYRTLMLRFIVICISIIAALIFIEVIFRIYEYVSRIDFRLYTQELKNPQRLPSELFKNGSLIPGSKAIATTSDFSVEYSINSAGFRDKEYQHNKTSGKIRILMVGDSFTFGEGVPYGKRFSDILELNNPKTEIINMGFPGAGLDGIIGEIVAYAPQFHPDYVIILLNRYVLRRGDIKNIKDYDFDVYDPRIVRQTYTNSPDTVYISRNDNFFNTQTNLILRNSYAFSFLNYKFSVYKLNDKLKKYDNEFWTGFKNCEKNDKNCDRLLGVNLTARAISFLNALNTISKNMNAQLVAVNIDTEPPKYFYNTAPPFPYHDLHTVMGERGKKTNLSFTYDHHYNPDTNAFIAKQMDPIIKSLVRKFEQQ